MNSRLVGLVIPLILGVWPSSAMTINHTAGAVFMAETPLIIASAMEMSWVSVPFPVVPAVNRTLLDIAFQEHQYMLTERWKEWNGKICGDRLFTELVNKSSRTRNRRKLHLARVAETVPERGPEVSRDGSGSNGQGSQTALISGRQQAATDPRIGQLVSVQSDLLTQMQNMTAMMGRFVNSIIPAPHQEAQQRPRQLLYPYPEENRSKFPPGNGGRYGMKIQTPREVVSLVDSPNILQRSALRKSRTI